MTSQTTQLLCIGSVLWDIIGRTDRDMRVGHDVAGHITRLPGGVAYNIAQELVRLHLCPTLLTSVGNDDAGRDLIAHCAAMGMITDHIHISDHFKTDTYMAIEASNGLEGCIDVSAPDMQDSLLTSSRCCISVVYVIRLCT